MTNKRKGLIKREAYILMPKEIKTAIRWAFRALGIVDGHSRQAGLMVLYAELLYGKGIIHLDQMLQTYHQGNWVTVELTSKDKNKATLDAKKGHSLLTMPAIFDFAYAESQISGRPYSVEIYNIGSGVPLIEQLVYALGQRGLTCAWIPTHGTRFVANQNQICSYLPTASHPVEKTTRAVLSVGITTKFKKLDLYKCTPADSIVEKFADAEENGIKVSNTLWNSIDKVAKRVLVDKDRSA